MLTQGVCDYTELQQAMQSFSRLTEEAEPGATSSASLAPTADRMHAAGVLDADEEHHRGEEHAEALGPADEDDSGVLLNGTTVPADTGALAPSAIVAARTFTGEQATCDPAHIDAVCARLHEAQRTVRSTKGTEAVPVVGAPGWRVRYKPRVASALKAGDVYWVTPTGHQVRSLPEARRWLEGGGAAGCGGVADGNGYSGKRGEKRQRDRPQGGMAGPEEGDDGAQGERDGDATPPSSASELKELHAFVPVLRRSIVNGPRSAGSRRGMHDPHDTCHVHDLAALLGIGTREEGASTSASISASISAYYSLLDRMREGTLPRKMPRDTVQRFVHRLRALRACVVGRGMVDYYELHAELQAAEWGHGHTECSPLMLEMRDGAASPRSAEPPKENASRGPVVLTPNRRRYEGCGGTAMATPATTPATAAATTPAATPAAAAVTTPAATAATTQTRAADTPQMPHEMQRKMHAAFPHAIARGPAAGAPLAKGVRIAVYFEGPDDAWFEGVVTADAIVGGCVCVCFEDGEVELRLFAESYGRFNLWVVPDPMRQEEWRPEGHSLVGQRCVYDGTEGLLRMWCATRRVFSMSVCQDPDNGIETEVLVAESDAMQGHVRQGAGQGHDAETMPPPLVLTHGRAQAGVEALRQLAESVPLLRRQIVSSSPQNGAHDSQQTCMNSDLATLLGVGTDKGFYVLLEAMRDGRLPSKLLGHDRAWIDPSVCAQRLHAVAFWVRRGVVEIDRLHEKLRESSNGPREMPLRLRESAGVASLPPPPQPISNPSRH